MHDENRYRKIHCSFPVGNKSLTIELPLDIEFKLNVLASKKGISSEKLSEIIVKDYINTNCKNKTLEKYFE